MHRRVTRTAREREIVVGLAGPSPTQRVKNTIGSPKNNGVTRDSRQRERKTCLHGFFISVSLGVISGSTALS